MSSIIRRRRGLMGVSVMGVLPEVGLNTQSSDSTSHPVTALLIALGTRCAKRYRESGLVQRRYLAVAARAGEGPESTLNGRSRSKLEIQAEGTPHGQSLTT